MTELRQRMLDELQRRNFAAVWGAHIYQSTVLVPVWASEPPKSLLDWLASPYAMRVPGFFRRLVGGLYTVATTAVVVAVLTGVVNHCQLVNARSRW